MKAVLSLVLITVLGSGSNRFQSSQLWRLHMPALYQIVSRVDKSGLFSLFANPMFVIYGIMVRWSGSACDACRTRLKMFPGVLSRGNKMDMPPPTMEAGPGVSTNSSSTSRCEIHGEKVEWGVPMLSLVSCPSAIPLAFLFKRSREPGCT